MGEASCPELGGRHSPSVAPREAAASWTCRAAGVGARSAAVALLGAHTGCRRRFSASDDAQRPGSFTAPFRSPAFPVWSTLSSPLLPQLAPRPSPRAASGRRTALCTAAPRYRKTPFSLALGLIHPPTRLRLPGKWPCPVRAAKQLPPAACYDLCLQITRARVPPPRSPYTARHAERTQIRYTDSRTLNNSITPFSKILNITNNVVK